MKIILEADVIAKNALGEQSVNNNAKYLKIAPIPPPTKTAIKFNIISFIKPL